VFTFGVGKQGDGLGESKLGIRMLLVKISDRLLNALPSLPSKPRFSRQRNNVLCFAVCVVVVVVNVFFFFFLLLFLTPSFRRLVG
jgi:hypothetical protein